MTEPRVLQNFSSFVGHLVASDLRAVDSLKATLERLGASLVVVPVVDGRAVLDVRALRDDRDLLFVDADLGQPLELGEIERPPQVPVIGLVGVEAPSRLKTLIQIGATAFLRKPVQGAAVYSALFIGINGFLRRRQLESRLEDHERRRRGRRLVIKAILDLMQRAGIDDDQAYAILRRESMKQRLSIEDYCATAAQTGRDAAFVGGTPGPDSRSASLDQRNQRSRP